MGQCLFSQSDALSESVKLCRQLCQQLKYLVHYRLTVITLGPDLSQISFHVGPFKPVVGFALVSSRFTLGRVCMSRNVTVT